MYICIDMFVFICVCIYIYIYTNTAQGGPVRQRRACGWPGGGVRVRGRYESEVHNDENIIPNKHQKDYTHE